MPTWTGESILSQCQDAIVDALRGVFMEKYTITWPIGYPGTLSLGTSSSMGTVNITVDGSGSYEDDILDMLEQEGAFGADVPVVTQTSATTYEVTFPTKGDQVEISTSVVWSGDPAGAPSITKNNDGKLAVISATVPVLDRLIGSDRAYATPCCFVYPHQSESQDANAGTNLRDDITYQFGALFVASVGETTLPVLTEYREYARRLLHNGRLDGVSSVIRVTVEPMPAVLPDMYVGRNWIVSGLAVKCLSRESRY